jgi:hypothetical protein
LQRFVRRDVLLATKTEKNGSMKAKWIHLGAMLFWFAIAHARATTFSYFYRVGVQ